MSSRSILSRSAPVAAVAAPLAAAARGAAGVAAGVASGPVRAAVAAGRAAASGTAGTAAASVMAGLRAARFFRQCARAELAAALRAGLSFRRCARVGLAAGLLRAARSFRRCARAGLAAGLVAAALPGPALADPTDEIVGFEVLPGWRTGEGTHLAALRLTLAPGWKTYWRAPGDAGIPPAFAWQGSRNLGTARLHWPVPEVFHVNGMQSIGYSGQVVIPLELSTPAADAPSRMRGEVQIGVCEEICIPMTFTFDTELPVQAARDPAIVAALIDRPMTAAEAGVGRVLCRAEPGPDGLRLSASIDLPPTGAREVVVIEAGDPGIWVSEAATRREGGALHATVDMADGSAAPALDRAGIRITVLGTDRAVDILGCERG